MAQDNDVERFCVGTELEGTAVQEARWRNVITGTLGVTGIYTGPLLYAESWTYTNTVMFWDLLDYIGIDAYYPVALTTTATLTGAEKRTLRAARMTYSGHGGWRELWGEGTGPLAGLADRLIPALGAEEFFELC
jgi:hypothetical protein